jgi:hypothetical protein
MVAVNDATVLKISNRWTIIFILWRYIVDFAKPILKSWKSLKSDNGTMIWEFEFTIEHEYIANETKTVRLSFDGPTENGYTLSISKELMADLEAVYL